jgi:hypothetical protein
MSHEKRSILRFGRRFIQRALFQIFKYLSRAIIPPLKLCFSQVRASNKLSTITATGVFCVYARSVWPLLPYLCSALWKSEAGRTVDSQKYAFWEGIRAWLDRYGSGNEIDLLNEMKNERGLFPYPMTRTTRMSFPRAIDATVGSFWSLAAECHR